MEVVNHTQKGKILSSTELTNSVTWLATTTKLRRSDSGENSTLKTNKFRVNSYCEPKVKVDLLQRSQIKATTASWPTKWMNHYTTRLGKLRTLKARKFWRFPLSTLQEKSTIFQVYKVQAHRTTWNWMKAEAWFRRIGASTADWLWRNCSWRKFVKRPYSTPREISHAAVLLCVLFRGLLQRSTLQWVHWLARRSFTEHKYRSSILYLDSLSPTNLQIKEGEDCTRWWENFILRRCMVHLILMLCNPFLKEKLSLLILQRTWQVLEVGPLRRFLPACHPIVMLSPQWIGSPECMVLADLWADWDFVSVRPKWF